MPSYDNRYDSSEQQYVLGSMPSDKDLFSEEQFIEFYKNVGKHPNSAYGARNTKSQRFSSGGGGVFRSRGMSLNQIEGSKSWARYKNVLM